MLEKRNLAYCWWGCKLVLATMENSMKFLQNFFVKIKNRTIRRSSNPTSESVSKGAVIRILKTYLHSQIHCFIIHNSEDMKAT